MELVALLRSFDWFLIVVTINILLLRSLMRLVAVHGALYLSGEIAQENFHHRAALLVRTQADNEMKLLIARGPEFKMQ